MLARCLHGARESRRNGSGRVPNAKRAFAPSVNKLTATATALGGFVASSKTFENADVPNGAVTVRVPSARFDDLVRQVRDLGKVRSVSTSGDDVTAQFTDAALFADRFYLCGPGGLLAFDLNGTLVAQYRLGMELPPSPLTQVAT